MQHKDLQTFQKYLKFDRDRSNFTGGSRLPTPMIYSSYSGNAN